MLTAKLFNAGHSVAMKTATLHECFTDCSQEQLQRYGRENDIG